MEKPAELSDQQAATVTTRASGMLIAFSLATVALCLWFCGSLLALVTTLSAQEGSAVGFLAALLGPGLVAAQQYRGTFRASAAGARFCAWFFGVVAVFAGLPLFPLGSLLFSDQHSDLEKVMMLVALLSTLFGIFLVTAISSFLNYLRWKQLVKAEQALQPVVKSPRFTLLEMMALMLGVGLVLGGAASYSHFSQ